MDIIEEARDTRGVVQPLLSKPSCVPHGLGNRHQQGYEADLGDREHMLGFDVEASDTDGHEHDRPSNQCLSSVIVYSVPILFGFKSLPNTKAVVAVHLDFAKEKRDAHSDAQNSQQ
jgi:hypothetical protein